jgi:hypothetical protein
MRRITRKNFPFLFYGLASALAAVVLIAGVLLLALMQGWQREPLVGRFETFLSEAVGIPIEIGSLEGPILFEFVARDVRVGEIDVSELHLDWRVMPLLVDRRLVIDRLLLSGLDTSVERDSDGTIRLPLEWSPSIDEGGDVFEFGEDEAMDWRIDQLVLQRTRVRIQGTLGAAPLSIEAHFDGRLSDLALAGDGLPSAATWGALHGRLAGDLLGWSIQQGDLELAMSEGRALDMGFRIEGDFGATRLDLQARLPALLSPVQSLIDEMAWELDRLIFQGAELDLAVSGTGQGDELEKLSIAAKVPEIERWATRFGFEGDEGAPSIAGSIEASADLAGKRGEPSGSITILGRGLKSGDIALGRLEASFRVEDGRLVVVDALSVEGGVIPLQVSPGARFRVEDSLLAIEMLTIGSGDQRIDVAGRLSRDVAESLSVKIRRLELDRLLDFGGSAIRPGGTIDVDLDVSGPWSAPVGKAGVDWHGPARPGNPALDSPRVEVDLATDGRAVRLSAAVGAAARADVARGSGFFPIPASPVEPTAWLREAEARAELSGDALELSWLTPWIPSELAIARGQASFELSLLGRSPVPRWTGWLAVEDVLIESQVLADAIPIEARIRMEDAWVSVERAWIGPEQSRVTLSGRLSLEDLRPSEVDLQARFDGFQITPMIAQMVYESGEGLDFDAGRIDGEIRFSGRFPVPVVEADLDWQQPRWQSFVLDRVTFEAVQDGSILRSEALVTYSGTEIARITASLPMPTVATSVSGWLEQEEALVQVRSRGLELGMLAPWLPIAVSDPKGRAELEFDLRGGTPVPRIQGRFTLSDGSLVVRPLARTFGSISAVSTFDDEKIRIESLSIGLPGARAEATGTVELRQLRIGDLDLHLTLDRFPLSRSRTVRTDVTGALSLTGRLEAPELRGELALVEPTFSVLGASDPGVKEIRILAGGNVGRSDFDLREPNAVERSSADQSTIDVLLVVPRNSWIRGPGLDLAVSGTARTEKRPGEPARYSGAFETQRGTLRLQGRRFEVQRGRLKLDGGTEFDPVIEVEALNRVADVRIKAFLTGRLSSPELRLESEPEMQDADIVSYLIFGRPAEQLGASEQSGVNAAAASLAAGMALEELRTVFGDAIPIDTIDVQLDEEEGSQYVEVGKYVARDLFVRYGQTFGPEPKQEVGVSWRVRDHWILESTTSSDASAGADVFWVLEY